MYVYMILLDIMQDAILYPVGRTSQLKAAVRVPSTSVPNALHNDLARAEIQNRSNQ